MKKLILAAMCGVALTGCQLAPETRISGTINGQPFKITAPKDGEWKGLDISATSNNVSIKVESISVKNNPDVIKATAEGRVIIIDASGRLVGTAAGAAGKIIVP